MSILAWVAVGVIGALISGWIVYSFGHPAITSLNTGSMVIAFIGAVVSLRILRQMTRSRARVYSVIEFSPTA